MLLALGYCIDWEYLEQSWYQSALCVRKACIGACSRVTVWDARAWVFKRSHAAARFSKVVGSAHVSPFNGLGGKCMAQLVFKLPGST